jgi:uncharacterized protein RhaS with RHS repeats
MSGGLTHPQGWNRYNYVANDPVNYYDPEGLYACDSFGGRSVGFISMHCVDGTEKLDLFSLLLLSPLTMTTGMADDIARWVHRDMERAARLYFSSRAVAKSTDAAKQLGAKTDWSAECEETLDKLGITSREYAAAAERSVIRDGEISDEPFASLYKHYGNPALYRAAQTEWPYSIAEFFIRHLCVNAVAELNSSAIYIRPSSINAKLT